MPKYLNRAESRDVDQVAMHEFGMSGLVLMENAGRGCVDVMLSLGVTGPVAICCGKGNNGGDGFVIARHLELRGCQPQVVLLCAPNLLTGDAAENFAIAQKAGIPIQEVGARSEKAVSKILSEATWIVDALLGTGARGAPKPPMADMIDQLNRLSAHRLAVDLPSGLDCDTGEPYEPTIQADHTCTFVAPKQGFQTPAAAPFLGSIHVIDIGAPKCLIDQVTA